MENGELIYTLISLGTYRKAGFGSIDSDVPITQFTKLTHKSRIVLGLVAGVDRLLIRSPDEPVTLLCGQDGTGRWTIMSSRRGECQ